MNESDRPSVDGLMEVARQYAHAYFNRYSSPTHPGCEGDEPRFKASLRTYAERLCAVSAQPVASPNDADRKLLEQAVVALMWHQSLTRPITRTAEAIAALRSRLDGPNAALPSIPGEKP